MEKPSLKITYDAFQCNKGVEDFNSIEQFKSEIDKSYSSLVKANPVGRGGGAYQLIVDFFANLTAKDYFLSVGGYLAGKVVDKIVDPILDRYIFNPLKNAYKNLKAKNPILDCYSVTIELIDTKIFLYSISPDSIIENKDRILLTLYKNFENLIRENEFPSEIHIPVYEDQIGERLIYRPPLGINETIDTANNGNFLKLWGLKYQYSYGSFVYDVAHEQIVVDTNFMTEDEINHYKKNY